MHTNAHEFSYKLPRHLSQGYFSFLLGGLSARPSFWILDSPARERQTMRTRRCHRHRLLSCCGWFWCWLSTTVSLHHHHVQAQEPHVASTTTTRTLPPLVPLDPQDAKHWASLAAAAGEPSLFEDKASVASSSPHHHRPLRNTVSSTRTLHWRSSKPTSAPTRVPTSMAPTLANGETTTTQIPLFCSTAPNDGGLQCLYVCIM